MEQIVQEYSAYAYTVVKNMTSGAISKEDIEEIVVDTFFILWKKQFTLDDEIKITAYLVGIIKNLVRKKAKKLEFNDDLAIYENRLVSQFDLNEEIREREQSKIIENTLQNMSKEENEIFRSYYYAGKKGKDIAKELNITESKVKTKLHRIRKKIKKELMKGGYDYGE